MDRREKTVILQGLIDAVKTGQRSNVETFFREHSGCILNVNVNEYLNNNSIGGFTPLSWAICSNNTDEVALYLIERLTSAGASTVSEKAGGKYNQTPLMLAIEHENINVFNALMTANIAKVTAKDGEGKTPLMYAITVIGLNDADRLHMVTQLLCDSSIKEKDNDGNTALIHAARRGNAEVIRLLLNHTDCNGKSAFQFFIEDNKFQDDSSTEVLEIFLREPTIPLGTLQSARDVLAGRTDTGNFAVEAMRLINNKIEAPAPNQAAAAPVQAATLHNPQNVGAAAAQAQAVTGQNHASNNPTPSNNG